jgi:hypothetical protein
LVSILGEKMSTFELTGEATKLVGQGTQGDFVLSGQTLATDDGFKNVSKIWYDQTISVDEALEKLSAERESQEDVKIDADKLSPYYDEETGEVGLEDLGQEKKYKLTAHAWRQYGTRIDVPHTIINYFIQGCSVKPNGQAKFEKDNEDAKTFYNLMLNNRRHFLTDKLLIRTYNGEVCRAVLTQKYKPIDNAWFLETLGYLIPGGRVSHQKYCDADTLRFNLLIPDSIREEKDSEYGGMISITNCEIGKLTNSGTPSLFRAICMNGCIWDQTKGVAWKQVHRGTFDKKDLTKIMQECIQKQIPLLDNIIKQFLASQEWELGDVTVQQILTQLCIDHSLNGEQTVHLFEAYAQEKQDNGFGIINAITRFAQTQNGEVWKRMDEFAGKMVSQGLPAWEKLLNKAKSITDEDLAKVANKKQQQNSTFGLIVGE